MGTKPTLRYDFLGAKNAEWKKLVSNYSTKGFATV